MDEREKVYLRTKGADQTMMMGLIAVLLERLGEEQVITLEELRIISKRKGVMIEPQPFSFLLKLVAHPEMH